MTKEFADLGRGNEPGAVTGAGIPEPSTGAGRAAGPASEPTDDMCKCGAPRSMKNVERCMRGHPMPGAVINPNKRGSVNHTRVEQLESLFTEDYKPRTHRQRMEVSRLAAMWEQRERLERTEAGSIEHQRLDGIIQGLVDRLEGSRPESAGASSKGHVVIVKLPDNGRDSENVCGEEVLREIRPDPAVTQSTPGASEPSRPDAVGLDAPAAGDDFTPPTVLERVITGNGIDKRVDVKRRPVTEREVEAVLADSGDLENYRRGRITRSEAYRMAANVLKARGEMHGGIVQ